MRKKNKNKKRILYVDCWMWEKQPSGKKLVFRKIDTRIQNSIQITNNWIGLDWLAGTGVATTLRKWELKESESSDLLFTCCWRDNTLSALDANRDSPSVWATFIVLSILLILIIMTNKTTKTIFTIWCCTVFHLTTSATMITTTIAITTALITTMITTTTTTITIVLFMTCPPVPPHPRGTVSTKVAMMYG